MLPSLQALKFIGIAIALALAALGGWTANGWRLNDRAETLAKVQAENLAKAEAAYAAKLLEQQNKNDELVRHEDKVVYDLNAQIDAIRKEKHAPLTISNCEHPFTAALPAELNRLSDAANGAAVPPDAAAAPNPAGTAEGNSAPSALTGQQLVDWYADVAKLYGQCKAQLDAIREWDRQ